MACSHWLSFPWGVARSVPRCGLALVGSPGALLGRALVGPLGPCGAGPPPGPRGTPGPLWAGPLWAPWALEGRALVGPPCALVGRALVDPPGPPWSPQGPGPQVPMEPTSAHGAHKGPGSPQGQGPAHKGRGGPTRIGPGPQGPRWSCKAPHRGAGGPQGPGLALRPRATAESCDIAYRDHYLKDHKINPRPNQIK